MRIVHLALSSTYNEEFSYQENLLPRAQAAMKHDVFVVARNQRMENGRTVSCEECCRLLEDGVTLIRIKTRQKKFNSFSHPPRGAVLSLLISLKPDLIWVHSVINQSLSIAVAYKKKSNCLVVADNHLDEHNFSLTPLRRLLLLMNAMRNRRVSKHVARFYGVTPGRQDFMVKHLGVPKDKSRLCVMGADDFGVGLAAEHSAGLRTRLGYLDSDFLIVTGGKINQSKKTIELVEAVRRTGNEAIKLIIFGTVDEDIKERFRAAISDPRICFLGWKTEEEINQLFLVSNLGVFLNSHSVLWENACACSLPCVFGMKDGFEHLFRFGNSLYYQYEGPEELASFLDGLVFSDEYGRLSANAKAHAADFMYGSIVENLEEDLLAGAF